jgi:hypothetical protein
MKDFKEVSPTADSAVCGPQHSSPQYSSDWSGYQVPNSCCNNAAFTWAESAFNNLAVASSGSDDVASFWSGIGNSVLIQDGVDGLASNPAAYAFWYQDYPQTSTYVSTPSFYGGDTAYVYTLYQGYNVAYYYFEDETTGESQPYQASAPYVGFRDANFIAEKQPGIGLANFGNKSVSDSAYGTNSTAYELPGSNGLGAQTDNVIMTSNGGYTGHLLAEPSTVANGDLFEQIWFAAN